MIHWRARHLPQPDVLDADDNRLATEQDVTNPEMHCRDLQIGIVKALVGGFDATAVGLASPLVAGSVPAQALTNAPVATTASAHATR